MGQYDEYAAVPMDGEIEVENENQIIPEGEYLFRIVSMKREQVEKTEKMPNHTNIRFQIKLEHPDGTSAGNAFDNIRMYMKWAWKFSDIAKSIGHTPPDSRSCRIAWDKFVGAEGRVKVTIRDWKKSDGTIEKQNAFKYLPPAPREESDDDIPF